MNRRRTINHEGEATVPKSTKALLQGERGKINDTEFLVGSRNVYADLGHADAEEKFAKLKLAMQVNHIIEENGWNQTAAAKKLGTQQPEISNLKRGRLRNITYDRLMEWLVTLGYSVKIEVERSKKPHVEVAITV
jgi:predicted XRE-type DNA-binding protein